LGLARPRTAWVVVAAAVLIRKYRRFMGIPLRGQAIPGPYWYIIQLIYLPANAKESMLPPDAIATCCRPFTRYVMGEARHSWPVSKCQSVLPDAASTAAKLPPVSP